MQNEDKTLIETIKAARREVARALQEGWQTVDGASATANLMRLDTQLRETEKRLNSGSLLEPKVFSGIVRWVTDWAPNTDDPLVTTVAKLEALMNGFKGKG